MPFPWLAVAQCAGVMSVTMCSGDAIAQGCIERRGRGGAAAEGGDDAAEAAGDGDGDDDDGDEGGAVAARGARWDPARSLRFACFGAFAGVTTRTWFWWLQRKSGALAIVQGQVGVIIALEMARKMVWAPVGDCCWVTANTGVRELSLRNVCARLRSHWQYLVALNWAVWPPMILVQWLCTPPQYRFAVYALTDMAHDVGLSYIAHLTIAGGDSAGADTAETGKVAPGAGPSAAPADSADDELRASGG